MDEPNVASLKVLVAPPSLVWARYTQTIDLFNDLVAVVT